MYSVAKNGEIIRTRVYDDTNVKTYNKLYLDMVISSAIENQLNDYDIQTDLYIEDLKKYSLKLKK